jgi:hypothetical protein
MDGEKIGPERDLEKLKLIEEMILMMRKLDRDRGNRRIFYRDHLK